MTLISINRKMRYLLLAPLFMIAGYSGAQQEQPEVPAPPNGVWLHGQVFIDQTEIANIHWLEFLHFLGKDSSSAVYNNALPDTTVWFPYDSAKVLHYLRYPGYRYYPVVGVSFEQARTYCAWRSGAINHRLDNATYRKEMNIPDNANFKFIFRLPTEQEWEEAAAGGLDKEQYPFGYRNYEVKPRFERGPEYFYKQQDTSKVSYEDFKKAFKAYTRNGKEAQFNVIKTFPTGAQYTTMQPLIIINPSNRKAFKTSTATYRRNSTPNAIGVSDMIGNVAEMVSERTAKGGSWAHALTDSEIKDRQFYVKPQAWLGFRCACEVQIISK